MKFDASCWWGFVVSYLHIYLEAIDGKYTTEAKIN